MKHDSASLSYLVEVLSQGFEAKSSELQAIASSPEEYVEHMASILSQPEVFDDEIEDGRGSSLEMTVVMAGVMADRRLLESATYLIEEMFDSLGLIEDFIPSILADIAGSDHSFLMARAMDDDLDDYLRMQYLEALAIMGLRHQHVRHLVEKYLSTVLADGSESAEFNSYAVMTLAGINENPSVPSISDAFSRGILDETIVDQDRIIQYALENTISEKYSFIYNNPADLMDDIIRSEMLEENSRRVEASEIGEKLDSLEEVFRNAGRNDDCPCGSGRKYKKCCYSYARRKELAEYAENEITGILEEYMSDGRYNDIHAEKMKYLLSSGIQEDGKVYDFVDDYIIHDHRDSDGKNVLDRIKGENAWEDPEAIVPVLEDWSQSHLCVYVIKEVRKGLGFMAVNLFGGSGTEEFILEPFQSFLHNPSEMLLFRPHMASGLVLMSNGFISLPNEYGRKLVAEIQEMFLGRPPANEEKKAALKAGLRDQAFFDFLKRESMKVTLAALKLESQVPEQGGE